MYKALHRMYDAEDAQVQVNLDWTRDVWSQGSKYDDDCMSEEEYANALFELVDLWTLTIDPLEYVHFLATLYHRITRSRSWLTHDGHIITKNFWRRQPNKIASSNVYRPYAYDKYMKWKNLEALTKHVTEGEDGDDEDEDEDEEGDEDDDLLEEEKWSDEEGEEGKKR